MLLIDMGRLYVVVVVVCFGVRVVGDLWRIIRL